MTQSSKWRRAPGLPAVSTTVSPPDAPTTTKPGGFCVIELNATVDFGVHSSFPGLDVFADAMGAVAGACPEELAATAAAIPS